MKPVKAFHEFVGASRVRFEMEDGSSYVFLLEDQKPLRDGRRVAVFHRETSTFEAPPDAKIRVDGVGMVEGPYERQASIVKEVGRALAASLADTWEPHTVDLTAK